MDTMTMTSNFNGNSMGKGIEDRFTAAVNVIRGLPKNGKYINQYKLTTNVYLKKMYMEKVTKTIVGTTFV